MSEQRKFNPGHAFVDGKLIVFSPTSIEVTRAWGKRAGSWLFTSGGSWRQCWPDLRIARAEGYVARASRSDATRYAAIRGSAYAALLETIPWQAKERVRPFAGNNWPLIQLHNRFGEMAGELIDSTPALAFLVAVLRPHIPRLARADSLRRLLTKPQSLIASAVGLDRPGAVNVLRKIPIQSVASRIRLLRNVEDRQWKRLLHLPRVNAGVLAIVTDLRAEGIVEASLLNEVGILRAEDAKPHVYHALLELVRIADFLGDRPPRIRCVEDVKAFHDRAVTRLNRGDTTGAAVDFPEPPIPGTDAIRPLRSSLELRLAARHFRNCAVTYTDDVLRGERYVYVVNTEGGEAMLSIVSRHGAWEVAEISGIRNSEASQSCRDLVRSWLVPPGRRIDPDAYAELTQRWVRDGWIEDADLRWRDLEDLELEPG